MTSLRSRPIWPAIWLILIGATIRVSIAAAGEPSKQQPVLEKLALPTFMDGALVFDVEERVRGEFRLNNRDFDSSADEITDDAWLLNRFRLGLAVKPISWLRLYAQTQDSREAFSDRPNIPGVRGAEGDDVFDLRQANIVLGDLKQFPFLLNLGRQAVNYGDNRLVADSRWGNFGRTFDGARLRYEQPQFWVESFFIRPVQIRRGVFDDSDAADNFAGIYFSTGAVPKQTSDFYVFYRDKRDDQPDLDPTNRTNPDGSWNGPAARFATVGARMKSTPNALNGWDYSMEVAAEKGEVFQSNLDSRRFDLSAWALHVAGGYTVRDLPWQPRIGLEYDYGSGDHDPTDNESESFQNLYPSNHEKYGFMDEFSWRNLHDARFQLNVKPLKSLEFELDYHAFWLANTHDYWYRSNGFSTLRTQTPDGDDVRTIGARNFAGQEIDLTVTMILSENIKVQTGYSHFFAGDYLVDTGPHSDADFAYGMVTFSY